MNLRRQTNKHTLFRQVPTILSAQASTGLLLFCAVVEMQISSKSAKSRKIHKKTQNTTKFARNLTKYMSKQQIWTLSLLLGLFTCYKLANLSWNVVTATNKQQSKTATSQWPSRKNWPWFKTLCHWHISQSLCC